jgi:hypothetical protein
MFLYDIEQGRETMIPSDINQESLPMSMRYYDSIIAMVQENISDNKRESMIEKQRLAYNLHLNGDILHNILIKTGMIAPKEKEPLVFKYSALNKKPPQGINHFISHHVMSL